MLVLQCASKIIGENPYKTREHGTSITINAPARADTRGHFAFTVFIIQQQNKTTLYLSLVYVEATFAWHSALRMTLDLLNFSNSFFVGLFALFGWMECFFFRILLVLRRLSFVSKTFLVLSRRFCCCCCYFLIVAYDF